jgi:NACHT domain-containing protein
MVLGEFALALVLALLKKAIESGISYAAVPYFTRRKIERRIEDATAEVVEPLLPFLAQEGISEAKQRRLLETCVAELEPLTNNPEMLFKGSLNGQKIFEEMYATRKLPQVIVEDGLKEIYTLLCPRIATLLGRIPAAVKDWESEAWSENFRRFDEMTDQMRSLFTRVDELATSATRGADETLTTVRRALAQKIGFELDLTGLRADSPVSGKFDDFFVHPQIRELLEGGSKREPLVVETPNDSLEKFAAERQSAILIGAPGAGKSTWSKWLQKELLSARWAGICIRVELRSLSTENIPSLQELVRDAAGRHIAEDLTAERIGQWLKAKQIIFILDGFDEIRPDDRDLVLSWISDLSTTIGGSGCVLTSRPLTTGHLDQLKTSWGRWNIEPFDQSRIVDYIQRWYRFTPLIADSDRAVDAPFLASGWRADPTIRPLTGNPLLLSTLLMVHHLDGRLPSGRSQLYQRYVGGMLGLWDDRRKVMATTAGLTLEQKRRILRGLALLLFLKQEDQIDEPEVLGWLQTLLEVMKVSLSAAETLATLRERSGLIVGPGIYSFAHKSVAEYLVAETILQGDQQDSTGRRMDRFRLFEHRDDDRWNTVTFLWAGLAPVADVESFIDESIEAGSLRLASGILDDQYDKIPRDIQQRLLKRILVHNDALNVLLGGHESYIQWIASYTATLFPDRDHRQFAIPTFGLRGLTPGVEFQELVLRAIQEDLLTWADIDSTEGALRDLLWMSFATHVKNLQQWKICLAGASPEYNTASWFSWIVEYVIRQGAHDPTIDLDDTLREFTESCPSLKGLLPFALMSVSLGILLEQGEERKSDPRESIGRVLRILPMCDDGEIVPEFLLGTRDWVLGSGRKIGDEIGDLFPFFEQAVTRAVHQGTIDRDDSYKRAISFVRDLRAKR